MNFEKLKNRTILMFGKSRAFSSEEFASQIKHHNIRVVTEYEDDVSIAVEGKMMTPYEQDDSDALYKRKVVDFITIDALENMLAKEIDADVLLMSLKLSHDKDRLKDFLTNSMISDELFLKLLKMYSWRGEGFFENDDNRDVSAALIVRFYENIERNHNVEYATTGIMHLIVQSKSAEVIEAVSLLEPLKKSFNSGDRDVNYNIMTAIATHHMTPRSVLSRYVKDASAYVRNLIALREDCDAQMQEKLYNSGDEVVREALSHNQNLDRAIVEKILDDALYAKNIAKYIKLDGELFHKLKEDFAKSLASNETISADMQEELFALHNEDIQISLASNLNVDEHVMAELLCAGSQDISFALYANASTPQESLVEAYANVLNHFALSYNEKTPPHILTLLSESVDVKVLKGVAKNPSTPIETLYQLQLNRELERYVKENPSFAKHIQSENIGWL